MAQILSCQESGPGEVTRPRVRVLTRCRVRSALLTSLDGLASDELFAIPATRTASVYIRNSTAREN